MSKKSEYLLAHGWKLVMSKSRGMIKVQRWNNGVGGSMTQEDAYRHQKAKEAHTAKLNAEAATKKAGLDLPGEWRPTERLGE